MQAVAEDAPLSTDATPPDTDLSDGNALPDASPDAAVDASESAPVGTSSDGSDATVSPDATADPSAPVVPVVPAVAAPVPLRVPYFGRKGDDPEFELKGAVRHADGRIEIPSEATDRTLQLLGKGRQFERVAVPMIQQLEHRVQDAETRFNEDASRGNALWSFYQGLAQQPADVQQAWWSDFVANQPKLEAAVDRQIANEQYEAARKLREPSPDQLTAQSQAQTEQAQGVFLSILQAERAKHPHVSEAELMELAEEMWEDHTAYIRMADYDDPSRGVVKGQPAFDMAAMARRFGREASRRKPATPPVPSIKTTQNAKVIAAGAAAAALPQATPPGPTKTAPSQPRNADGTFLSPKEQHERAMAAKYRL